MDKTSVTALRLEALKLGYLLRPVPPIARQTAKDVRSGATTSRAIASRHGLLISAAHMRLRTAERYGLIEQADEWACPTGGIEMVWEAVV